MTTRTGHTPGPWVVEAGTCHTGEIAMVHGAETENGEPTWLEVWSPEWPHNADANARLIAAAPELLAALKAIVEDHLHTTFPPYSPGESPYDKGRAAIARAEGGSDL